MLLCSSQHAVQRAGEVASHEQLRVHDHVDVVPRALSAIDTESTRKDMSSVTTSTTVCPPADQPLLRTVGVNTRTLAVP